MLHLRRRRHGCIEVKRSSRPEFRQDSSLHLPRTNDGGHPLKAVDYDPSLGLMIQAKHMLGMGAS